MQAAVEIQRAVQTCIFNGADAGDNVRQCGRRIEMRDVARRYQFDGAEALGPADGGLVCEESEVGAVVVGGIGALGVAADPGVDADFVADAAAEEGVDGDVEAAGFEVPERDVDAGEGGLEGGTATIERLGVEGLVDEGDLVAVEGGVGVRGGVEEMVFVLVEGTFDGECVLLVLEIVSV